MQSRTPYDIITHQVLSDDPKSWRSVKSVYPVHSGYYGKENTPGQIGLPWDFSTNWKSARRVTNEEYSSYCRPFQLHPRRPRRVYLEKDMDPVFTPIRVLPSPPYQPSFQESTIYSLEKLQNIREDMENRPTSFHSTEYVDSHRTLTSHSSPYRAGHFDQSSHSVHSHVHQHPSEDDVLTGRLPPHTPYNKHDFHQQNNQNTPQRSKNHEEEQSTSALHLSYNHHSQPGHHQNSIHNMNTMSPLSVLKGALKKNCHPESTVSDESNRKSISSSPQIVNGRASRCPVHGPEVWAEREHIIEAFLMNVEV